jgi:two-component system, cell cycle sensor histidine kinase and response regulator CckA
MKQGPSHTILAVTNRTDKLELLTSTIALAEYTVLKATNLNAAVRLAIEQQPDLILIDVSKQQTALDLHRRIRSTRELTGTPVLVIGTKPKHFDFATDSTKDDLLETPYESITLAARVARLVERKRTQDELRRSQQRYFELFNNANDIVYTHDLKGCYNSLNKRGQQVTGYSPDELATLEFKDLATPADVALAYGMLQKKLNGEATNTVYELSIKAKDGTIIPFEVNSQLMLEDGKPVGVQGIARDIRARKEAEEKLLEAERRGKTESLERIAQLAQILASARELHQIFNALLQFTTSSLPCNALGIALYDHEQVELTPHFLWLEGMTIDLSNAEPFPVTNNSDIRRAILSAKTIISKSSSEQSIPRLLQSATAPTLSSSMIVPMTIMGRTIGILEIHASDTYAYQREHTGPVQMAANLAANTIENVRLLNREREQETQLRHAQKMEAIGLLAGNVAHDVNNFVTTMYGNCDALLRGLDHSNPLRRHVFELKQSATRAAMLTKQLLAFGRKQVLKPVNLNLNTVVTHIMEQFIARLIGEDISIICNLADDLPQITADKNQLETIIINLAINARDAMATGGTITIETSIVYPDKKQAKKNTLNKNNPYVQLSITDTGIGMSAETQKYIFEPFFTTKREGKGTGLGLASVFGAVKQSGGSISVSSKEGHGTTFHIQFPVAKGPSSETSVDIKPDPIEALQGTQTILIAEDDASVRQVLKDALSHAGYTILEAINGADALEKFKRHNEQIQLVITDVLMPQMNGRDLELHISSMRSAVHVLYISGYPKDVITDRGGVLLEGVNFLAKPFNSNDLLHTVRQILTEQEVVH